MKRLTLKQKAPYTYRTVSLEIPISGLCALIAKDENGQAALILGPHDLEALARWATQAAEKINAHGQGRLPPVRRATR